MTDLATVLADWGLNIAFWSATVFMLFIGLAWPFWKSFWGINIIIFDFAIALALIPSILAHDFGLHVLSSTAALWVEVAALWLVGIIVIWRGGLIVTEQLRGTKHHRSEDVLTVRRNEKTLMNQETGSEKKCQR
jgi:hypothetical protein